MSCKKKPEFSDTEMSVLMQALLTVSMLRHGALEMDIPIDEFMTAGDFAIDVRRTKTNFHVELVAE